MNTLGFDISHFLAGGMVVISFMLLYQRRLSSLLDIFAIQAAVLAFAVAWQAHIQNAPHLYITAFIALTVKAGVIPAALRRITRKLKIHHEIDEVVGMGRLLLSGVALVALAILVMTPVTMDASAFTREDLAFALSVMLLGFLMMISRHNAVSQIVGFMSMENGLVLAATGASGMPLVVEISVAFSILIALFVFGTFIFRIRERFDTVDVNALDRFRGERNNG
ncbi:MAG: hydrogenase-4 component E [Alphaproteobacteria bacterium]|nr:hydrogenase-4 component E [Alphaproteobacteria bacterium]